MGDFLGATFCITKIAVYGMLLADWDRLEKDIATQLSRVFTECSCNMPSVQAVVVGETVINSRK
eukprot:SAG31_NODE_13029_length_898_cov_1.082603_1_plen_64_part_10